MKQQIYKVTLWMRGTGIGAKAYSLLDAAGARICLSRLFNWADAVKNRRRPTEAMLHAREYFKAHRHEVEQVKSLLADQKSVDVYGGMVRFRQYSEYSRLPHNSYRAQYFGNDFPFPGKRAGEGYYVFVDCGAYDGDTVRAFKKAAKKAGIRRCRAVAFEPDGHNFRNLRRNEPKARAIQAGVWGKSGMLRFSADGSDAAHIAGLDGAADAGQGDVLVPVCSIDEVPECRDAALIKMDIEGAEKQALYGAKETILRNRPDLAICIYHRDEDMVELPLLVHGWVPEYKIYIRQHSNGVPETVMYAVCGEPRQQG